MSRRSSFAMVFAAGIGLVGAEAGARAAAEGPGVLVSAPRVEGQAPEHLVEALEEGVRGGLADAGVEVVEPPPGCADDTCLAAEVSAGNARAYVSARVEVTGSDYGMVVELLDGSGGSLGRQEDTCEICSFEEVTTSMRELVARAARDLGPPPVLTGTVRVSSQPSGATVSIDGQTVGTTPYEGAVDVGPHEVALSLDGREPATQPIDVGAGETSSVDLALERSARISPRTTEIMGWAAIGVGVAALAGGITMLVLDENPVQSGSNCSGSQVDADGDCQFRYDTLGGGIGLTVAGAALAGGGAALVVISRKKQKSRGSAEVALVPGGLRARF